MLQHCARSESGPSHTLLQEWGLRLSYMAAEALGSLRCAHMFDIVVEWPDSLPAVRLISLEMYCIGIQRT